MGLGVVDECEKSKSPQSYLHYVNIPALTPGLHWAETTLEFSDNKTLFRSVAYITHSLSSTFSLYNVGTDRIKNTASNSSSIVACVPIAVVTLSGFNGNVFTESFPSNDRLFGTTILALSPDVAICFINTVIRNDMVLLDEISSQCSINDELREGLVELQFV
jgi:hypothetical protein